MASIQAEAASRGYTVGPAAAAMFAGGGGGGGGGGGSSAPAPAASSGRTGIGASYVQKQLDAGRSLQDIKSEAARRGYTIGAKAQSMFDNAAKQGTDYSASRGLPPTGRFFDPTNYSGAEDQMGSGGFGLSALQRARQAGYTDAQIRTTLAGAGVEIGGKAADALNVAAGKTFYTGADGKKRPDNVKGSYSGQAGTRKTRPFLLPKGAYNHAAGKPFTQNYLFAAGGANDAELANLYLRGDWKAAVPGEYGTYSEPDWNKYVGENGYMSAFPEEDAQGNAIPGTDKTPPELRYEEKFQESVASRGNTPTPRTGGSTSMAESVGSQGQIGGGVKAVAEDPTSEAPAPGDADAGGVVAPIKVDAESSRNELKQLDDNVGYLTSGAIRKYYNSRFR